MYIQTIHVLRPRVPSLGSWCVDFMRPSRLYHKTQWHIQICHISFPESAAQFLVYFFKELFFFGMLSLCGKHIYCLHTVLNCIYGTCVITTFATHRSIWDCQNRYTGVSHINLTNWRAPKIYFSSFFESFWICQNRYTRVSHINWSNWWAHVEIDSENCRWSVKIVMPGFRI